MSAFLAAHALSWAVLVIGWLMVSSSEHAGACSLHNAFSEIGRAGKLKDQVLLQIYRGRIPRKSDCVDSEVSRRRRADDMCSCRRRSRYSDGGWRCDGNIVVRAEPVWREDFDDAGDGLLNKSRWDYYIGMGNNKEAQYYTDRPENHYLENGILKLVGRREDFEGASYTSASIKSKYNGDWGPGHRIEVRAQLPTGTGTWPAIWMMPTDKAYGSWPNSGELDIMEAVGRKPGKVFGTIHTGAYNHAIGTDKGANYYTDFSEWHTYSVDWEESKITWYVDGNAFFTFAPDTSIPARWPFDQRFYLILNLAIGGTLGGHVSFSSDQVMEVDYAHVYCLDGSVSCKTPPYSCCNKCGSKSYCSPHSGNCYDSKNKDYYEACSAL